MGKLKRFLFFNKDQLNQAELTSFPLPPIPALPILSTANDTIFLSYPLTSTVYYTTTNTLITDNVKSINLNELIPPPPPSTITSISSSPSHTTNSPRLLLLLSPPALLLLPSPTTTKTYTTVPTMIAYIAATVTATDVVCASDSVVEVWGGAKMKLLHSLSLQTYPTLQSLTIVALDSPNSNVPPSTSPTPIYLTTASTTTPPVLSLYTLSSSTTTHTTASSPFTLVSTPIQSFTLPHDSTSPLLHLCDSTIRFPHAPILHTPPTASTAPICAQPHLLLNNILTVTPTAAPTASDTSETSDAAAASRLSIDVHSTNHPIQTYHLLTSPNVTSVATVTTSDTFVTVTNTGVIYLLKLKPHDAIMDVLVRKVSTNERQANSALLQGRGMSEH